MSTSLTKLLPNLSKEAEFGRKKKLFLGKFNSGIAELSIWESWHNVDLCCEICLCKIWGEVYQWAENKTAVWSRLLLSRFSSQYCAGSLRKMLSPSLEPVSELFQLQWSYLNQGDKQQLYLLWNECRHLQEHENLPQNTGCQVLEITEWIIIL